MVDSKPVLAAQDCILFSTADWDEPYWTNKQHTAVELADRGWRILYIESVGFRAPRLGSKKDWGRLWRRLWRGIQSVTLGPALRRKNVWVLSPLIIPIKHHWRPVRWFNRHLLKWAVSRFARVSKFGRPLVWTYHPFVLSAIEDLPHGVIVYHCVDDITAIPGVDVDAFNQAERALLAVSGAVFTTVKSLEARCAVFNPHTYNLGNVVDAEHFGAAFKDGPVPEDIAAIPRPRLVYHGVLSDFKLDFALLLAAASLRPEWQWVFIGTQREGQNSEAISALAKLDNVHFLGYRTYQVLPAYLRGMDVGLLPSLLNQYTSAMFPMKYFEYLAAGLPVVSTPLAFTQQTSAGLEVASDVITFVAAIERQLSRGRLSEEEARNFVGDNTWSARTEKMLRYIHQLEAR